MNCNEQEQGPVVQSIVNLMISLLEGLLSLAVLTKSVVVIFFAEKL